MPFPTNPNDNDFYVENGVTWVYVSPPGVWTKAGGSPLTVIESDPVFTASAAASYTEAPVDGSPYSRQDGGWVAAGSGGATVINDLTDVNTAGVTGGDVLKWDGSQWTPTVDDDVDSLVDLTDTTITTPANGEVLQYNGAAWVNAAAPAGYTDADVDTHLNTGTASAGEILSWTGSDYDWIAAGGGGLSWETTTVFGGDTVNYAPATTWLGIQDVDNGYVLGSKTDNASFSATIRLFGGTQKSYPYHGGMVHYAAAQTVVYGRNAAGFAIDGGRSAGLNTSGEFAYHGDATTTPKFKVNTQGEVTFNNAFTFPNSDGTSNQVLTTNGSGTVTWADAGGGSSLAIDESGRIESNNWITTANNGGEDRFYFKASDSVSATPTWRGQAGGGFQFNIFNVNESITFSDGADAVEITGSHQVTGGIEGLRLNAIGGGTSANMALFLAANSTDRMIIRGTNIIMPTLPTSDPGISGALWNDAGTLKIS